VCDYNIKYLDLDFFRSKNFKFNFSFFCLKIKIFIRLLVINEGSGQKCFNINKNIFFIDENLTKPRLKIHIDNAMFFLVK
jgi:hypothetical protein